MKHRNKTIGSRSTLKGRIEIQVRDRFGKAKPLWNENRLGRLIRRHLGFDLQGFRLVGYWDTALRTPNLVVSAGKAGAASRLNGAGGEAAFTYLAVGTGTNSAAAGDTGLQTEITDSGLARASATATRVTTSVTNDTAQLDKTWSVTGTKAITESGIFNASSGVTLLARQTFSAVNVVNGDTFAETWKVQVS